MEGELKLYSGLFNIYRDRYCILIDEILTICYERGGEIEGQVHLGVYTVKADNKNLILTLSNGYHKMNLKANSLARLVSWTNRMNQNRNEFVTGLSRREKVLGLSDGKDGYGLEIKKEFKELRVDNARVKLNDKLADVWAAQARLSELLNKVQLKVPKDLAFSSLASEIHAVSTELKVSFFEIEIWWSGC